MPRLAGAAADHAQQTLVMTFPRRALWLRAGLGIGNGLLWLSRRQFHVFIHRPSEIMATSQRHGLQPVLKETGLMWTLAALSRAT